MSECSTFITSGIPVKPHKPHGAMFQRENTEIKMLLRQYRIPMKVIQKYVELPESTVQEVLSLKFFGKVRYRSVLRVRVGVQVLLAKAGYAGDDTEFARLWAEYDKTVIEDL